VARHKISYTYKEKTYNFIYLNTVSTLLSGEGKTEIIWSMASIGVRLLSLPHHEWVPFLF
jgi:hypothetical protein